jgi:hypothetical protein
LVAPALVLTLHIARAGIPLDLPRILLRLLCATLTLTSLTWNVWGL